MINAAVGPRSYLYVPADAPRMLARLFTRAADAVILDLEDAVPIGHKDRAREGLVAWLATQEADSTQVWVRVNTGARGAEDALAFTACPVVYGICMPKVETAAAVRDTHRLLSGCGSDLRIMPMIESAAGVLACTEIARSPGVVRLHLGEEDLKADTGIEVGPGAAELRWARSMVVMASAAAGLCAPVAPIDVNIEATDDFERSCRALRRLGYGGRACIHPNQVEPTNRLFAPSMEQIQAMRDLVEQYDAAAARGIGVFLDSEGRMVDEAVLRQARRIAQFGSNVTAVRDTESKKARSND